MQGTNFFKKCARQASMSEGPRSFNNNAPDYDTNIKITGEDNKILKEYYSELFDCLTEMTSELIRNSSKIPLTFKSVYIGTLGITMALDKISKFGRSFPYNHSPRLFDECKMLYETFLKKVTPVDTDSPSFLEGISGYYAFMTVYHYQQNPDVSKEYLDDLIKLYDKKVIERKSKTVVDEILYGTAGYLYALIYILNNTQHIISPTILSDLVSGIIESGKQTTPYPGFESPLNYTFHHSYYLGAAHGYVGIFYMLLDKNLRELHPVKENMEIIMESIDSLFDIMFSSGNLPSSLPRRHDKLVQWCHGSPGAIYLAIRCYKITKEDKYLKFAEKLAKNVWERGILTKSVGLCHGVSGNAYSFLAMYNCTHDDKYLYYAVSFARWICAKRRNYQIADRPWSLYEGLAGVIYFFCDLYDPSQAMFPGFQTSID